MVNEVAMPKRPQDQSQAEWLADYTGEPVAEIQADRDQIYARAGRSTRPSDNAPVDPQTAEQAFAYSGHRTTTKNSLVLDFINTDTGEIASAFFNISIEYQRGAKAGQSRRTGTNGQFYPKPRSKFRRFWTETVGHPPRRWSEVHKEMRSQLSKVIFSGSVESASYSTGESFLRIKNVRKTGDIPVTRKRQLGDNLVTTKRQAPVTSKPRKPKRSNAFKQAKLHDKESAQKHINTDTQTHNSSHGCYTSTVAEYPYVEIF